MLNVKVNQVYVASLMAGRILRRIRILASHPDGGYLIKVLDPKVEQEIQTLSDFSINKVYRLEQDVCEHKAIDDAYIDGGSNYPPSVPNYYKCTDCGDLFPNTGDTALWFPKVLKTKAKENE